MRKKRTIKRILQKNKITIYTIEKFRKLGKCNGCGGKGGFNFSDYFDKNLRKFKNFKNFKNFYKDLRIVCDLHDLDFINGKNFKDFLKANLELTVNINLLLHWTGILRRLLVSFLIFFGTTLFGWNYFINKK